MFDFKNYEPTSNLAVDAVASCVYFYRQKRRALKTIYLSASYYALFKVWVMVNFGEEKALTSNWEFDGVNIAAGTRFQTKPLVWDFWPEA
jgi:hypothetical protein